MKNTKYTDLIGRHLSGNIEAGEKAELMAWVGADSANKAFFDEMVRLWRVSEGYEEEPFAVNTETAWAAFEEKLEKRFPAATGATTEKGSPEARVVRMNPLRMALRYAAAAAVLLAAGYWILFPGAGSGAGMISLRTGAGEKSEVTLPDGSTVLLNERSELTYAKPFEERKVTLVGEAFFQVARVDGKSFAIEAEGATTTVLGTSFNVRAYPSESKVEVSVKTGKVALRKTGDESRQVILEAGQAGAYNKQENTVGETLISNADAWKTSRLEFDSIPMSAVVEALERYFDIDIEVANPRILKCTFQGRFEKPELQQVLQTLEFTMMLEADKQNGTYVLAGGDASLCE